MLLRIVGLEAQVLRRKKETPVRTDEEWRGQALRLQYIHHIERSLELDRVQGAYRNGRPSGDASSASHGSPVHGRYHERIQVLLKSSPGVSSLTYSQRSLAAASGERRAKLSDYQLTDAHASGPNNTEHPACANFTDVEFEERACINERERHSKSLFIAVGYQRL